MNHRSATPGWEAFGSDGLAPAADSSAIRNSRVFPIRQEAWIGEIVTARGQLLGGTAALPWICRRTELIACKCETPPCNESENRATKPGGWDCGGCKSRLRRGASPIRG